MLTLLALSVVALPGQSDAAQPEAPHFSTSGNVTLASNYVFRGLTQTDQNPAVQAGLTLNHTCGFYAGFWGSNVSWFSDFNTTTSSGLELDLFAGYKHALGEDLSCDVGLLRYEYPGSYPGLGAGVVEPNTTEAYAALTWKWFTLKGSYSLGDTFGVDDSSGSWYADLSGTFPLPQDFTLLLHAGHQDYAGDIGGTSNDSLYSYSDYSAAISRTFGEGLALGVTYSHTNARDAGYTILGDNIGDDQWVLSLTKSF